MLPHAVLITDKWTPITDYYLMVYNSPLMNFRRPTIIDNPPLITGY